MAAALNYSRFPGPGDFSPSDREARITERADQIRHDIENDPKRLAEIDEYVACRLDGSITDQLFSAIADLHEVDADRLLGSKELTRLYHLAKAMHTAREAQLAEHAYEAAEGEALAREERRNWGNSSLRIASPAQIEAARFDEA